MKHWVAIAVIFACALAYAGERADPAFERLSKVEVFAFGGIGRAGVTSPGEKDFRIILSRPSAMADFERLYTAGNLQAKSYALAGIRMLDTNRFKGLLRSLGDSKETVQTQSGCLVFHESLGEVLKHIAAGQYSRSYMQQPR